MKKIINRHFSILELLNQDETLEINALAERLGVSPSTVRKDLNELESQGLLQRKHGYAARVARSDIGYRMVFDYDVKKRIAARACEMISYGEVVMIESGSTCAMLAEEIAKTKRDVTIITNSVFICGHIRLIPGVRVIILGGSYNPEAQVMTGSMVRRCAEQLHVDKFFFGTDGYHPGQGFYGDDIDRVEAVRCMAAQASKRIILTTSQKFGRRSLAVLLPAKDISTVITDSIPGNCRKSLEECGVEIILAR